MSPDACPKQRQQQQQQQLVAGGSTSSCANGTTGGIEHVSVAAVKPAKRKSLKVALHDPMLGFTYGGNSPPLNAGNGGLAIPSSAAASVAFAPTTPVQRGLLCDKTSPHAVQCLQRPWPSSLGK